MNNAHATISYVEEHSYYHPVYQHSLILLSCIHSIISTFTYTIIPYTLYYIITLSLICLLLHIIIIIYIIILLYIIIYYYYITIYKLYTPHYRSVFNITLYHLISFICIPLSLVSPPYPHLICIPFCCALLRSLLSLRICYSICHYLYYPYPLGCLSHITITTYSLRLTITSYISFYIIPFHIHIYTIFNPYYYCSHSLRLRLTLHYYL